MTEKKAQGAIEYLLIIGAAILVVAVVIVAITSVLQSGKTNTNDDSITQTQNELIKSTATKIVIEKDTSGGDYNFQKINLRNTNCTFGQAVKSIFELTKTETKNYEVWICETDGEKWTAQHPCCFTSNGIEVDTFKESPNNCDEKIKENKAYGLWVYEQTPGEEINKTWTSWCE